MQSTIRKVLKSILNVNGDMVEEERASERTNEPLDSRVFSAEESFALNFFFFVAFLLCHSRTLAPFSIFIHQL